MTPEKKQEVIRVIVGTVLALIITIAGILGYDAFIVTPRVAGGLAGSGAADKTYDSLAVTRQLNAYGTLTVSGATALNGGLALDTNKFTVADTSGNTAIAGTLEVTGVSTAGTFLRLTPATAITVTNGSIITPTASYQPVRAAGSVATASIAIKPSGTMLRLINTSANTITITDTGTLLLSGNIALGQYDSLLLLSDGTNWVQLSTSNN